MLLTLFEKDGIKNAILFVKDGLGDGRLAQLVRAPRLHRGGLRFESVVAYQEKNNKIKHLYMFLQVFFCGKIYRTKQKQTLNKGKISIKSWEKVGIFFKQKYDKIDINKKICRKFNKKKNVATVYLISRCHLFKQRVLPHNTCSYINAK